MNWAALRNEGIMEKGINPKRQPDNDPKIGNLIKQPLVAAQVAPVRG